MNWMFLPLKRYADFKGRSRRKEYWLFALFTMIVSTILYLPMMGAGTDADGVPTGLGLTSMLLLVFILAILVPSLAVQVRRFHDQDKSGWMVLLNLIPLVGGLIVFVFMCLEGTRGPNRYGADPKAGETVLTI